MKGAAATASWPAIRIVLLGDLCLLDADGADITPKGRKARAILAMLALNGGPVTRSSIGELLWGDRGEAQARASVRQALYELRTVLGAAALTAGRERVVIDHDRLPSDLDALERAAAAGHAAVVADRLDTVNLPVLGGLDEISGAFDDWLRDARARIERRIVTAGQRAATLSLNSDPQQAAGVCTALERIDPLNEDSARCGLKADCAAGDQSQLHRRYARLCAALKRELDVAPGAETSRLFDQLRRPAARADGPAPSHPPDAGEARPAADEGTKSPARLDAAGTASAASAASAAGAATRRTRLIWSVLLGWALVMLVALWWVRPAPGDAVPSIAVLPFRDAGAADPGYFGIGVSEEILDLLSHQDRVRVLGPMSARAVADADDAVAQARALGVTHLVDGSVQTRGTRVRAIVRLLRTSDGAQLWSQRYDRQLGDIFAIQGEIARSVTDRLARSLGRGRAERTTVPGVYDRYLAARALARERRLATLDQADRLLNEAIRIDPGYAPAYAELSQVTMLRADHPTSYGTVPMALAQRRAQALARRAIALDPELGDGYAAMGLIRLSDALSIGYYRKAVALSPQRADFHRWYGQSLLALDRYDEAVREIRRAVAIDPLWGANYDHLVHALFLAGRQDEARPYVRDFLNLSTDSAARLNVRLSLAFADYRLADVVRLSRAKAAAYPDERNAPFKLASTLALLGERRPTLDTLGTVASPEYAVGRAALRNDVAGLARIADREGADFWVNVSGLWQIDWRLIEGGYGDRLVDAYDAARRAGTPFTAYGGIIAPETTPALVWALRQAGRDADAARVAQALRVRLAAIRRTRALPETWQIGEAALAAALSQDDRALALLETVSRRRPLALASFAARSPLVGPPFARLAADPRAAAIDARVRRAIDRERRSLGLPALTDAQWGKRDEPI